MGVGGSAAAFPSALSLQALLRCGARTESFTKRKQNPVLKAARSESWELSLKPPNLKITRKVHA